VDQSLPDFWQTLEKSLSITQFSDCGYLHLFRRYLQSKFKVVWNCTIVCIFLVSDFFLKGPPKFWT